MRPAKLTWPVLFGFVMTGIPNPAAACGPYHDAESFIEQIYYSATYHLILTQERTRQINTEFPDENYLWEIVGEDVDRPLLYVYPDRWLPVHVPEGRRPLSGPQIALLNEVEKLAMAVRVSRQESNSNIGADEEAQLFTDELVRLLKGTRLVLSKDCSSRISQHETKVSLEYTSRKDGKRTTFETNLSPTDQSGRPIEYELTGCYSIKEGWMLVKVKTSQVYGFIESDDGTSGLRNISPLWLQTDQLVPVRP